MVILSLLITYITVTSTSEHVGLTWIIYIIGFKKISSRNMELSYT